MNEENVLKERAIEEASFGMGVDIGASSLGKETFWKFVDVNSVSAILSSGIFSIGLVGSAIE